MPPPRSSSSPSSSSTFTSSNGNGGNGNGNGSNAVGQNQQPDYIQDLMTLSDAAVQAYEADNLLAMEATINPSGGSGGGGAAIQKLEFYALPMSWLKRAWPVLYPQSHGYNFFEDANNNNSSNNYGESWREQIGIIENAQLVALPPDESSSSSSTTKESPTASSLIGKGGKKEEGVGGVGEGKGVEKEEMDKDGSTFRTKAILEQALKRRQAQLHQHQHHQQNQQQHQLKLKTNLKHSKDFVFIGKNVWMIIKEKFGYDGYEIRRTCVHVPKSTLVCSNSTKNNNRDNDDGDGGNNDNHDLSQVGIELLPGEATKSGEMTSLPVVASASAAAAEGRRVVRVIRLPASSRFPYEKYVVGEEDDDDEEENLSSPPSSHNKETGEDKLDDMDEKSKNSRREERQQQQQQQQDSSNSNVQKKTNEGGNKDEEEDENQFSAMNSRVVSKIGLVLCVLIVLFLWNDDD